MSKYTSLYHSLIRNITMAFFLLWPSKVWLQPPLDVRLYPINCSTTLLPHTDPTTHWASTASDVFLSTYFSFCLKWSFLNALSSAIYTAWPSFLHSSKMFSYHFVQYCTLHTPSSIPPSTPSVLCSAVLMDNPMCYIIILFIISI